MNITQKGMGNLISHILPFMPEENPKTNEWGNWRDLGPLNDGSPHVRRVEHRFSGRHAVLKGPGPSWFRDGQDITLVRFREEAHGMIRLNGQDGVLPILDYDPADDPRWFVMPTAQLLADVLAKADLRAVVSAMARVSATLARLAAADEPIAHRDIKPENLFCIDGDFLVGDFGIATWPSRVNGLTKAGDWVGPHGFIAPEMREYKNDVDPYPADVWSVAKTLYVLARPERGKLPPEGTHTVGEPQYSLHAVGGAAATSLEYLLEAATAYRPVDRLQMRQFHDELASWLTQHPVGTVFLPPSTPGRVSFSDPPEGHQVVRRNIELAARRRMALERRLKRAIKSASEGIIGVDGISQAPPQLLEDGQDAEGEEREDVDDIVIVASGLTPSGHQLVLAGLMFGPRVEFRAQWQNINDSNVLVRGWASGRVSLGLPIGEAHLSNFISRVVQEIKLG